MKSKRELTPKTTEKRVGIRIKCNDNIIEYVTRKQKKTGLQPANAKRVHHNRNKMQLTQC